METLFPLSSESPVPVCEDSEDNSLLDSSLMDQPFAIEYTQATTLVNPPTQVEPTQKPSRMSEPPATRGSVPLTKRGSEPPTKRGSEPPTMRNSEPLTMHGIEPPAKRGRGRPKQADAEVDRATDKKKASSVSATAATETLEGVPKKTRGRPKKVFRSASAENGGGDENTTSDAAHQLLLEAARSLRDHSSDASDGITVTRRTGRSTQNTKSVNDPEGRTSRKRKASDSDETEEIITQAPSPKKSHNKARTQPTTTEAEDEGLLNQASDEKENLNLKAKSSKRKAEIVEDASGNEANAKVEDHPKKRSLPIKKVYARPENASIQEESSEIAAPVIAPYVNKRGRPSKKTKEALSMIVEGSEETVAKKTLTRSTKKSSNEDDVIELVAPLRNKRGRPSKKTKEAVNTVIEEDEEFAEQSASVGAITTPPKRRGRPAKKAVNGIAAATNDRATTLEQIWNVQNINLNITSNNETDPPAVEGYFDVVMSDESVRAAQIQNQPQQFRIQFRGALV